MNVENTLIDETTNELLKQNCVIKKIRSRGMREFS